MTTRSHVSQIGKRAVLPVPGIRRTVTDGLTSQSQTAERRAGLAAKVTRVYDAALERATGFLLPFGHRRVRIFSLVATIAAVVGLAGCGGDGASSRGATTVDIPSASMEPTLHCAMPGGGCEGQSADRVVIASVDAGDIERGDILLFVTPRLAAQRCGAAGVFLKRVIALPGEKWRERNGVVFIDGVPLDESYVMGDRRDTGTTFPAREIPQGEYFVMGDNRTQSCDSREWGPVPAANIRGRLTKILRRTDY